MTETSTRSAIGTLLFLLTGPIGWAAHFTLLYGSQSSLCALDIGETAGGHNGLVVLVIIGSTVLVAGMLLAAAVWARAWHHWLAAAPLPPDSGRFLEAVMRILVALSVLAMAYAAMASLILPACAQLR